MRAEASSRRRQPVRLVVVERGAPALATMLQPREDLPQLLVLIESASPPDLAFATIRRLKRLERTAQRVAEAVILVGRRNGEVSLAKRCLLCRALLNHQIDAGGGEIIFQADDTCDADTRQELLAIAGTLTSELRTSEVSVNVRFGVDARARSRPFAKPPEARVHAA